MKVPSVLLKKLYVKNSLKNTDEGFEFTLKNVLMDGTITSPVTLTVDNKPISHGNLTITAEGKTWAAADISDTNPAPLKVNVEVNLSVKGDKLAPGEHEIGIAAATKEYGDIEFTVKDSL